jgi:hypothetical protein
MLGGFILVMVIPIFLLRRHGAAIATTNTAGL